MAAHSLPLVKISLLRPFAAELRRRGVEPQRVFESVGLHEDMVHDPEASVHVMVITQFVENAAIEAKDVYFASRVAARVELDGWPPLAMAEAQAATISEYLTIFVSTANEIASSAEEYLHIDGQTAVLGERRKFSLTIAPAQNDAFMASLGWAILRRALHDDLDPSKVTVIVSDPRALPPEFDMMHPIKGDRRGFKLRFPSAWLTRSFNKAPIEVHDRAPMRDETPEFITSFRQFLRAHVGRGPLTAEDCARLAAMSQSKLKRRLAEYGTSITAEISIVQRDYARRALADTESSISDIASALGYTDPANFARAFRRANGVSPTAFRQGNANYK